MFQISEKMLTNVLNLIASGSYATVPVNQVNLVCMELQKLPPVEVVPANKVVKK